MYVRHLNSIFRWGVAYWMNIPNKVTATRIQMGKESIALCSFHVWIPVKAFWRRIASAYDEPAVRTQLIYRMSQSFAAIATIAVAIESARLTKSSALQATTSLCSAPSTTGILRIDWEPLNCCWEIFTRSSLVILAGSGSKRFRVSMIKAARTAMKRAIYRTSFLRNKP